MPTRLYHLTADGLILPLASPAETLDAQSATLPDGIYTTFRTYGGPFVLGLDRHLYRLVESHQILDDDRPLDLTVIRAGVRAALADANLPDVKVRITTPFGQPDLYIGLEPLTPWPADFYENGVLCRTSTLERDNPQAKYTAFIAPSRAEKAAADPTVHEFIRLNPDGYLLEGFSSNFFALKNGQLHTADEGVLAGVTRSIVLTLAEQADLTVVYTPIHQSDLPTLTEAFITSASREVMPIRQLDDVILGPPGPVARALLARYRAYLTTHTDAI